MLSGNLNVWSGCLGEDETPTRGRMRPGTYLGVLDVWLALKVGVMCQGHEP